MQGYVCRNQTKCSNDIVEVQEFVTHNLFDPARHVTNPNSFFFYGLQFDENGKPIIGDGSEEFPFRVHLTSVALLKYLDDRDQNNRSVFHLDATYKLNLNRFKLVCFGRSDVTRRFHPITYMLTSKEEEVDFHIFFTELIQIALSNKIFFQPYYIMQDAAKASAAAVSKLFPGAYILMCWFHLKKCVKDNLHRLAPKYHDLAIKGVNSLHFSYNSFDFEQYCIQAQAASNTLLIWRDVLAAALSTSTGRFAITSCLRLNNTNSR
jgi:hypothetical protein